MPSWKKPPGGTVVLDGDCPEDAFGALLQTAAGFRAAHVRCYRAGADREILDVIAEEDRAATFFTYYAEHVGDMFGLAGEGRSFKEPIVHILRFRDGKVCEHWRVENELSMMKQLGRLPATFEYEATAENMKY